MTRLTRNGQLARLTPSSMRPTRSCRIYPALASRTSEQGSVRGRLRPHSMRTWSSRSWIESFQPGVQIRSRAATELAALARVGCTRSVRSPAGGGLREVRVDAPDMDASRLDPWAWESGASFWGTVPRALGPPTRHQSRNHSSGIGPDLGHVCALVAVIVLLAR